MNVTQTVGQSISSQFESHSSITFEVCACCQKGKQTWVKAHDLVLLRAALWLDNLDISLSTYKTHVRADKYMYFYSAALARQHLTEWESAFKWAICFFWPGQNLTWPDLSFFKTKNKIWRDGLCLYVVLCVNTRLCLYVYLGLFVPQHQKRCRGSRNLWTLIFACHVPCNETHKNWSFKLCSNIISFLIVIFWFFGGEGSKVLYMSFNN